jgi:hypothetical protein
MLMRDITQNHEQILIVMNDKQRCVYQTVAADVVTVAYIACEVAKTALAFERVDKKSPLFGESPEPELYRAFSFPGAMHIAG